MTRLCSTKRRGARSKGSGGKHGDNAAMPPRGSTKGRAITCSKLEMRKNHLQCMNGRDVDGQETVAVSHDGAPVDEFAAQQEALEDGLRHARGDSRGSITRQQT